MSISYFIFDKCFFFLNKKVESAFFHKMYSYVLNYRHCIGNFETMLILVLPSKLLQFKGIFYLY